jgi:hypothetical protein
MTTQELTSGVRRLVRHLGLLASLAIARIIVPVIAALCIAFRPGYRPDEQGWLVLALELSALALPLLSMAIFFWIWTRWAVRCPHCQAPLGREMKKVYDVTATGICRECGKGVVDEMD